MRRGGASIHLPIAAYDSQCLGIPLERRFNRLLVLKFLGAMLRLARDFGDVVTFIHAGRRQCLSIVQ